MKKTFFKKLASVALFSAFLSTTITVANENSQTVQASSIPKACQVKNNKYNWNSFPDNINEYKHIDPNVKEVYEEARAANWCAPMMTMKKHKINVHWYKKPIIKNTFETNNVLDSDTSYASNAFDPKTVIVGTCQIGGRNYYMHMNMESELELMYENNIMKPLMLHNKDNSQIKYKTISVSNRLSNGNYLYGAPLAEFHNYGDKTPVILFNPNQKWIKVFNQDSGKYEYSHPVSVISHDNGYQIYTGASITEKQFNKMDYGMPTNRKSFYGYANSYKFWADKNGVYQSNYGKTKKSRVLLQDELRRAKKMLKSKKAKAKAVKEFKHYMTASDNELRKQENDTYAKRKHYVTNPFNRAM